MIFVVLFKLYQNEMILYDKCKNVLATGLLYKNIYKTVYMNGFIHFFLSFLSKKGNAEKFQIHKGIRCLFYFFHLIFINFNIYFVRIACCYVSGTTKKNDK